MAEKNLAAIEKKVLERLRKLFPDGEVHAQVYSSKVTGALARALRKLSMEAGQGEVRWLASKGFAWKESGYTEPDMRPYPPKKDGTGGASAVADRVFRRYPLAGEYIPTPEEEQKLYQGARQAVQKILEGEENLTRREMAVLTLDAVHRLRDWTGELLDSGEDNAFWRYLFLQYGFNWEHSDMAEKRLCREFCGAVRATLGYYKRFLAPREGDRYYTTLLLHALAPRQNIEELFQIVYDFYARNLGFQYVAEDIGYETLAAGIVRDTEQGNLSGAVSTELLALFRHRPGFAASLCASLVRKIDSLLMGENPLDTRRNYLDRLLWEWYGKQSAAGRARMRRGRRERNAEYIAASPGEIDVRYALRDGAAGLEIPGIRLPRTGGKRPLVRVYQGGVQIFQDMLFVTGNALCQTTRGRFVSLQETDYDFSAPPDVLVEIEYMGEILYYSGERLRRSWILFDRYGEDRTPETGTGWLLAPAGAEVEGASARLAHPGQLWRIAAEAAVRVDGLPVFWPPDSPFRCDASIGRLSYARAVDRGRTCYIFPSSFSLFFRFLEKEGTSHCRILVDGNPLSAGNAERLGRGNAFSPPCDAGTVHCVQVADSAAGTIRYEYRYIVLPGCAVKLDRPLYRDGVDEVNAVLTWNGMLFEISLPPPSGGERVSFAVPGLETRIEVDVPVVSCAFLGGNGFAGADTLWHREIPADERVELRLPDGWTGQLRLGIRPREIEGFALGKALGAAAGNGEEDLWLSLWDTRKPRERYPCKLATIVFSPRFSDGPLEPEDEKLWWRAEGNYAGESDSVFSVSCTWPDGKTRRFRVGTKDAVLAELGDGSEGRYFYQVYAGEDGTVPVREGEFIIGDPREYAYAGKEILIRDALCWDDATDALKTIALRAGCGILRDLEYQGSSAVSGENVPAPEYTATLYRIDRQTRELLPLSARASEEYEQVNPVSVWIVNDHLLILRCSTEDTILIDSKTLELLDRNPDLMMSKAKQYQRLKLPDYFSYEIRQRQD